MDNKTETIQVLDGRISQRFKVRLKYALFECATVNCDRTWGVNLINNQLRPDQLLCQNCAIRKISERP